MLNETIKTCYGKKNIKLFFFVCNILILNNKIMPILLGPQCLQLLFTVRQIDHFGNIYINHYKIVGEYDERFNFYGQNLAR